MIMKRIKDSYDLFSICWNTSAKFSSFSAAEMEHAVLELEIQGLNRLSELVI